MSRLRVATIVEGHGEVIAIRKLLERIWSEIAGGEYIEVLRPILRPRSKLLRPGPKGGPSVIDQDEVSRAVKLANLALSSGANSELPKLVLILLDADSDCPGELAPRLKQAGEEEGSLFDLAVVLANVEYETWFVAAAPSLGDYLLLEQHDAPTEQAVLPPESRRAGKSWIEDRFKGQKYSETVDQVKLTARMDLEMCRNGSPSFDKLCRELESRAGISAQG